MKRTLIVLLALVMVLCCACSNTSQKPLTEVYNDIKAQVTFEDVNELTDISQMERYYGITDEMAAEYAGCINASGVEQEEVVLVKAVDDAAATQIKEKLDTRYQSKLNQNKNYNAEQAAMIEKCSVDQDGLYVSMIISDNADTIKKIYREDLGLS